MRTVIVILAAAVICAAPLALAQEAPASAKPAFAKVDKDADGELTLVEIDASLEAYPELGLLRKAFTEIDVDENGVITVSEYEVWVPMEKKGAGCME